MTVATASIPASNVGRIQIRKSKQSGRLVYQQRGGNQTAVDASGISLDVYIHALFGLTMQAHPKSVLMIGCAGGTLATMLHRSGVQVTTVDIDPAAFQLARQYFKMPASVRCIAADGLAYLNRTRARYDVVIVDAFIGETVPPQFTGDTFCKAARRCLRRSGMALSNFCLDDRADSRADAMAKNFHRNGWRVRVFDQPGGERNAIVVAGNVARLRGPRLIMPPAEEAKELARELGAMRFRRRRKPS